VYRLHADMWHLYLLCCIRQTRVPFIYLLLNWVLTLVCMLTHRYPHTHSHPHSEHKVACAEAYLHTKWHLDASSRLTTIMMGRPVLSRKAAPAKRHRKKPSWKASRKIWPTKRHGKASRRNRHEKRYRSSVTEIRHGKNTYSALWLFSSEALSSGRGLISGRGLEVTWQLSTNQKFM